MFTTPHIRRGVAAGLIGLMSVVGFAGVADASTDTGTGTGVNGAAPSRDRSHMSSTLTDEQRQCLADAGLVRPTGRPTAEQRQAFEAAAANCGITLPARPGTEAGRPSRTGALANLSDEQRQCLADAGLSQPTGRPTAEQRQAFEAAAASCGVTLPSRGQ